MNKLKILIPLLCFFTLAASQSLVNNQSIVKTNDSYLLLPPANATGPDIIILGLNGAFCDPDLYFSLFQTIQNYSTTYKIWAAMPIFPGNFPSDLGTRFPAILEDLKSRGANTTDVFIAGHSLGGFIAQDFLAEANTTGYKGLILFGKFIKFQYKDPQVNFPVSVLTIGGELDGLSKISRISMSYNQMLSHPDGLGHIHFPVAIVPGAYHSSYITGDLPQVIADVDIKPEATGPEVWAVCAELVDAFINVQMNLDNLNSTYGQKVLLDHIYGYTYDLIAPLLKAFAWEGNPYLYNASLINTTEWVALNILDQVGLQAGQLQTDVIVSEVRNISEFYNEKPAALFSNQVLNYTVYTHKNIGVVESDDIQNPPNQSAIDIATKFKSKTFIFDISSLEMDAANNVSSTCKMLNQMVIDDVMAIIPNKTKERFTKWGVRLQAGDDIEYDNETSWNASDADYDDHWGYIDFKSARLETEVKVEFLGSHDAKGGDFFCKLLSPGKVAEWVYCDGLKRFDGAGTDNSTNATKNASSSTATLPAGFNPEAEKSASLSHFGGN